VISAIAEIEKAGYYLPLWETVKHKQRPEECKCSAELLKPFQLFWEALPDSKSIRRMPFWRICDLAELYCELPNASEP